MQMKSTDMALLIRSPGGFLSIPMGDYYATDQQETH